MPTPTPDPTPIPLPPPNPAPEPVPPERQPIRIIDPGPDEPPPGIPVQ